MNIYIAGCYEDRDRLKQLANTLAMHGYNIVSDWLYVDDKERLPKASDMPRTALTPPISVKQIKASGTIARIDLDDVEIADIFILDTRSTNTRGGREVELGYALARRKIVIVVGIRRNIFHCLKGVVYLPNWDALFTALGGTT